MLWLLLALPLACGPRDNAGVFGDTASGEPLCDKLAAEGGACDDTGDTDCVRVECVAPRLSCGSGYAVTTRSALEKARQDCDRARNRAWLEGPEETSCDPAPEIDEQVTCGKLSSSSAPVAPSVPLGAVQRSRSTM